MIPLSQRTRAFPTRLASRSSSLCTSSPLEQLEWPGDLPKNIFLASPLHCRPAAGSALLSPSSPPASPRPSSKVRFVQLQSSVCVLPSVFCGSEREHFRPFLQRPADVPSNPPDLPFPPLRSRQVPPFYFHSALKIFTRSLLIRPRNRLTSVDNFARFFSVSRTWTSPKPRSAFSNSR